MAVFRVVRHTPLSPAETWRRLTDWPRHGDVVPLTRVTVRTAPPGGRGTVFVARTGVGRLGFDDVMEVVAWEPPVRCRLEKRGAVVRGWAEISVVPEGGGARVVWCEELRARWVPDAALGPAGRWMFGRAVEGLLGRDA